MRSGTLARQTKISVDTLRHYERIGLLAVPPRTLGGYREYPAHALQRVILISARCRWDFLSSSCGTS